MSTTVIITPINAPPPDSPIELDFTLSAEFWVTELLVYLVDTQVPSVTGTLDPNHAYATIYVNSDTYDNLHGCLRDNDAYTVHLTYDDEYAVTDLYCVVETALLRKSGISELGLTEKKVG